VAVETIAALVAGAKAVNVLLDEATKALAKLGSSWRAARNGEAKQQAIQSLEEVRKKLKVVGDLARVGEEYTRVHEEVMKLLWECERAESFIEQHTAEFNKRNTNYSGNWRTVQMIFGSIDKNRDPVWSMLKDQILWYDAADDARANEMALRCNSAFDRGALSVRAASLPDVSTSLDSMISELRQLEQMLSATMYGKIFESLRELGH